MTFIKIPIINNNNDNNIKKVRLKEREKKTKERMKEKEVTAFKTKQKKMLYEFDLAKRFETEKKIIWSAVAHIYTNTG